MSSLKKSAVLFAVVAVVGWAALAQADVINGVSYIDPVSASASSWYQNHGDPPAPPSSSIDGDGGDITVATGQCSVFTFDTQIAGQSGYYRNAYFTDNGVGAGPNTWISWDLGQTYSLAGFHLWNYNGDNWGTGSGDTTSRGVKTGDVYISSDGVNWGTAVQSYTFTKAPFLSTYTGEDYSFSTTQTARYVKLVMTTNWGGSGAVGFNEIRFSQATPEPSSLALLAAGLFGLLAYAWRKRR